MESKQAAIVIPCWNQAKYLADAIESALGQTVPCEVIVVNDGSPDDTSEVALGYPVTLIEKGNGGLSSARNAGIKLAIERYNPKWILTLDADDKIAPDFVEKCIAKSDETGADIIGTWQQEFGDSFNQNKFQDNPTHSHFLTGNRINCCSLFRARIWEAIGGYDETLTRGLEDWQFWIRATKVGYKVSVVPEFLFFYRKHGHSMISDVAADPSIQRHMFESLKNYV